MARQTWRLTPREEDEVIALLKRSLQAHPEDKNDLITKALEILERDEVNLDGE